MNSAPEFTNLADLASERVGGRAIAANDDFFAPKSNLVKAEPAVFIPDKYTTRGKWMDGWESRRRRVPGHDWCIVQLGMRGVIRGVNVDTSHFTGNFPSHCSIEAVDLRTLRPSVYAVEGAPWTTILEKSVLRGNGDNLFTISDHRPWTHLRLSIYPDGGVARLRVFGEVSVDWDRVAPDQKVVDLASIKNGGLFLAASDLHYGTRGALIMPGRAKNMGDGWETKRNRDPRHTHDWAIVKLGHPGMISKIEIDTNHYKGNYPDRASLEGCFAPTVHVDNLAGMPWTTILPETKLSANKRHFFAGKQLEASGPFSHVRLNMFPDGGISRLRVYGHLGTDR